MLIRKKIGNEFLQWTAVHNFRDDTILSSATFLHPVGERRRQSAPTQP